MLYVVTMLRSIALSLLNHLQLCIVVQGFYLVEVRLLGYENPTEKCQGCLRTYNGISTLRCCDDFSRSDQCTDGGRECDSYFIYCLRPLQSQDFQEGGCSNSDRTVTSAVNVDDEMIDFTQSEILGLNNPFQLQGLTKDYRVSYTSVNSEYIHRQLIVNNFMTSHIHAGSSTFY